MSDIDANAPSRRLWVIAALCAVMLHGIGIALAVVQMDTDIADDSLGAPAIEVGLEMMSPRLEASDLPPGPDTDASAASPAVAEQKAEVKETDLPKAIPQESEDPDRVVTTNDSKKPSEEEPEKQAVQQSASTESVAAEATAMPSVEAAQEAPRSVAPAQGSGQSAQRMKVTWQKELVAHLDRHKRYPAERQQKTAEITVSFEIDRTGRVLAVSVVKSSGDNAFDEAAVAMVRRSDPLPAPPPLIADEGLSFTLPVIFRVKGKG
ncbi:energy transducer TonB [Tardiphaga sp.]|uniref:energy transducer TonB family protein n=1 Tax=Tardiphaga sp. TaxID=1926292 RepID=UPI002610328D|nr:energy transducer TonB [Tardiphaga sp.]MDB5619594.1 Energy transducer TonB [Tardiphaga sp.]